MRAFLITSITGLLLLAGCASHGGRDLIPYTDALRAQHGLSADEVARLQYYLSDTLVLDRAEASSSHRVVDGRLISRSQRTQARITAQSGTPGVATGVGGRRLNVSFAEAQHFAFAPQSRDPAAPYRLQATPTASGAPRVFVYDIPYRITSGNRPYLLIDRETLYRSEQENYRLPGRTLISY